MDEQLIVSTPGKIILFGEHSVVYGKLAIAASVSLRTKLVYTASEETREAIVLDFADVGLHLSLEATELDLVLTHASRNRQSNEVHPDMALNEPVLDGIDSLLASHHITALARTAASAFLYLYVMLHDATGSSRLKRGSYQLSSELPIGAGLGSSASVAVVTATMLLLQTGTIQQPTKTPFEQSKRTLDLINAWAFVGEQVIHGNPSGVDNTVATFGGCVAFRKNGDIQTQAMPSLPLLLTDTGVPKDTKTQVANVGKLRESQPEAIGLVLDEMDQVALAAQSALMASQVSTAKLGALVEQNQALLRNLGVSHASIEQIVERHREIGYTKLVGAGGGGCVFTLLKEDRPLAELGDAAIPQGTEQAYLIQLGGPGVGVQIGSDESYYSVR